MDRPVVIHYHLFKNAGSSVDRTLRENFGATWGTVEAEAARGLLAPPEIAAFLRANPWVTALSSHAAVLPAPELPGVEVIPILFVRHPLDRLRSTYDFEARQNAETPGSQVARKATAVEYFEWRLNRPADRSARNFQTHRLAQGTRGEDELERALSALRNLPFVGLVEEYDRSIEALQELLSSRFPRIRLEAYLDNVLKSRHATLEGRLEAFHGRLGDEMYQRLSDENRADLTLWEAVRQRYGPVN